MPHTEPGMAIGLFGGSFNPPHAGHLLVAETAFRRLGLDRVWWMVSPGNPLKDHGILRPIAERVAASRKLAFSPRFDVTAFEAVHRVRFTADALRILQARRPDVRFVWIIGADSLGTIHRWQDWRWIVETTPIAVVDRPGATLAALSSPMARTYGFARLPESAATALAFRRAPAWVFLHGPRTPISSTLIRDKVGSSS
ncbi:nicotinate-nucleotide adenylyltransferase [Aurantimonas sp. VKM B-3413]|uniref:nicotinate-nucleotide adenylyltransferase n=1 Tax=Aurantimonas sp. VKM B-3413 TaxID=2779401 RepID=UPI00351CD3A3|nr:nicotinate-nucleotide adenylyltransferase [Aurantimonas sp. VKM B-3413]